MQEWSDDRQIVFDRVKENEGKYAGRRMPYEDIVNISMNQVLMRSINTSISSILPVLSLLFIGSAGYDPATGRYVALWKKQIVWLLLSTCVLLVIRA